MGTVFSQGNFSIAPNISEEVDASLKQILHAFHHELSLQSRHPPPPPVSQSSNIQAKEPSKHSHVPQHHRSRSLDHIHSEEHQHSPQAKLSAIKRQWQCQFCHTKNESDVQICVECGSNKINVYVPIMDRLDRSINKNQRQHNSLLSPLATPVR